MTYSTSVRTDEQIQEQIIKARESAQEHGGTQWRGMTYEQGVEATLNWITGDDDVAPMDEEE